MLTNKFQRYNVVITFDCMIVFSNNTLRVIFVK